MILHRTFAPALAACVLLLHTDPLALAAAGARSDLDAFMARVLARRDENWKKLQQYVLDERERFRLTGPDGGPLYGFEHEYTWFIRDDVFVRSPLAFNGVAIGEDERVRYERDWVRRERARDERNRRRAAEAAGEPVEADDAGARRGGGADVVAGALEPRFVSAAYFLKFKFDPGHYALAGRERLFDREVLVIEYYPSRLFTEGRTRPNKRVRERDDEIEEKMNKVSLVTLWIDPAEHQILRYTFRNVDMDFLPGRSLVRVDEITASMAMTQPFPDVWLPGSLDMRFRVTTALGGLAAAYDVDYRDYRLADVKTRIRPPGR